MRFPKCFPLLEPGIFHIIVETICRGETTNSIASDRTQCILTVSTTTSCRVPLDTRVLSTVAALSGATDCRDRLLAYSVDDARVSSSSEQGAFGTPLRRSVEVIVTGIERSYDPCTCSETERRSSDYRSRHGEGRTTDSSRSTSSSTSGSLSDVESNRPATSFTVFNTSRTNGPGSSSVR